MKKKEKKEEVYRNGSIHARIWNYAYIEIRVATSLISSSWNNTQTEKKKIKFMKKSNDVIFL